MSTLRLLRLLGFGLLAISLVALFPVTVLAQAVSFSPASNYAAGPGPDSLAIGDLNGDGKPDLVVPDYAANRVAVLLGTGTGAFGSPTYYPVGDRPFSVAIGDLNGDGKPDLAVTNGSSKNVSILLGDGTGPFGPATNFTVGSNASGVALADFNGDNKPDLAVANAWSDTVSILLNTTNWPPVANAGASQTVECASHTGTSVTLNGSASSDPDGGTLTFQWTDASNNVLGSTAVIHVTAPLGTNAYTLRVTDPGGLASTASTEVTVKDTTPPVLTLSASNIVVTLPTASATGASVNLAGIASASDICDPSPTITNDAPAVFPVRTTTVTFTATDHSGNSSQRQLSVQVVYAFTGYFMPLLNNGQAAFKAGRTIPVKFQLTAADGTIVSNATPTLQVGMVSGAIIGTIDFTDATASGGSNTGNLFRFDPASGQYIYNLSTQGYAAGTYLIRATLNDGSTHDVQFSLK